MSGNVWEWCLNEYDHPQRAGLSGTARRVVRGGSWLDGRAFARTPSRNFSVPDSRGSGLGLRVVRSVPGLA